MTNVYVLGQLATQFAPVKTEWGWNVLKESNRSVCVCVCVCVCVRACAYSASVIV